MPYQGELANKVGHVALAKNPDVARFLAECSYLTTPTADRGQAISRHFMAAPIVDSIPLPDQVIAIDGSTYEASVSDQTPSTRIGFVQIGAVLVDMAQFNTLRVGRLVDPFRVADLQRHNVPLAFAVPSANIRWSDKQSVRDSFRAAVDHHLFSAKTRFDANDASTSLRTTLFHLLAHRTGSLATHDVHRMKLRACPACGEGPVEIVDDPQTQTCPFCDADVYAADCLHMWQDVTDFQSNAEPLSHLMLIIEHLLLIHYIRHLGNTSLATLATTVFFMDGPLALFGNTGWLHAPIMHFLAEVNARLARQGFPRLLIVGLQKTGQIVDHIGLIERYVSPGHLLVIDDDYRYRYILVDKEQSYRGFGSGSFYGQDFIYKTPSGRTFCFALPYPFSTKYDPHIPFVMAKTNMQRYTELPRALALIHRFESDLYENAVVPIALAHRYAAISLFPGGKVLDVLTRQVVGSVV